MSVDISPGEWHNHTMDQANNTQSTVTEEWPFGRRRLTRFEKTGQPTYTWQPLQQSDFLNPQPGDEFAEGAAHDRLVQLLSAIFRYKFRYNPSILVMTAMKIVWPEKSWPQPAPDLAVVSQVEEPERLRTVFDVGNEGNQPRFILEVTSPLFAHFDQHEKRALYAQAGIQEYFIVETTTVPYQVQGYRLENGSYSAIASDAEGRLWSDTNRLWLRINPQGDGVLVLDGRTGKLIEPDPEFLSGPASLRAEATFRAQSIAAQLGMFDHS